jgi:3-oxoacyl-[acyl-carrier protein] reductase
MKQMREQKSGVIINIGSITGEEGCAKNVAYSSSKSGAMYGMTKSLALYGAKYGVRCCCVSPGPVLTRPGMAHMKTALGRAAEPQEIVDAILFFASDKSAFTTGVNILIDGGRYVARDRT